MIKTARKHILKKYIYMIKIIMNSTYFILENNISL